jgi:hypothetical protein
MTSRKILDLSNLGKMRFYDIIRFSFIKNYGIISLFTCVLNSRQNLND